MTNPLKTKSIKGIVSREFAYPDEDAEVQVAADIPIYEDGEWNDLQYVTDNWINLHRWFNRQYGLQVE